MSNVTVWFIRCAIVYFLVAILLGIYMSTAGAVYPWMPIHAHFNLLGWMSMMIYGVAYHILPRFSGRQLFSDKLAYGQLWLANIGLIGMAVGWGVRGSTGSSSVLFIFSLVEALSIVFFAVNMLKTIKAAPPVPPRPAPKK
ncbi:MAG: cbb3-type cytochrome c oxidase subunit I [Thermodesulfobacteriota bacterium]